MSNLFKHELSIENKQHFVNITSYIQKDIKNSGIKEGIAIIYSPHTTAGITINENADPNVVNDLIYGFEKIYPTSDPKYRHFEKNSHAHLKSSTIGASKTLIITNGELLLGTWQNIYFCEFDGPRNRNFYVKVIQG